MVPAIAATGEWAQAAATVWRMSLLAHSAAVVGLAGAALLAGCGGSGSSGGGSAPSPSTLVLPSASASASPTQRPPTSAWPTYHGDNTRRGYAAPAQGASNPKVRWTAQLDGASYASPIVAGNLVIQATVTGSVYGLDAASGAVRWRTHLADPISGDSLPCGNISTLGVVGTPAYDTATGLVFAVTTQAGPQHVLYGVDARTGAIKVRRGVDVPGMDPATHLQRAALAVAGGKVYVAYGGNFGDCGQYLGRVVAVSTRGDGPLLAFAVPTKREAGIWGASGPAVLPGGDVLVTTGNGDATSGAWDHSDSVLRLSPTLALLDGFAPTGWAQENGVDADLGSTGPLVLPGGLAVAAGKGGSIYLVDPAKLGGVGGQLASLGGCRSYGGMAAGPAVGGSTPVYVPCTSGLQQVLVGPGRSLRKGWTAPGQVVGSPVVAGGIVWSVQQDGALAGLDAASGKMLQQGQVGDATRFTTPAVAGDQLLVATRRGVTAVGPR